MKYPEFVQCCAGGYTNKWTMLSSMFGQTKTLDEVEAFDPDIVEKSINFIYGASFLVTRQFVDEIGLMDERFFMYCEEQDWAFRAKNFKLCYAPDAHVLHYEGASTGMNFQNYPLNRLFWLTRSRILLTSKHFPHHLPVLFLGIGFAALRLFFRKIKKTVT